MNADLHVKHNRTTERLAEELWRMKSAFADAKASLAELKRLIRDRPERPANLGHRIELDEDGK